jgi:iron-sulfur cluster repair protein YtfE (RIC family)
MFQQLSDAIMRHVEKEEQQLFPKVQQANLDLNAIGLEMQAYDANVVSALAQASDRTGMRP